MDNDQDWFPDEKPFIGRIMIELSDGRTDALIEFLTRGKPISAPGAHFLGSVFQSQEFGGYAFRLEHVVRRGAPKTDSLVRARNAALWVHWTVNKPNNGRHDPKREDAIKRAARHYHVDPKRVREELSFFEQFRATRPREFRQHFRQTIRDTIISTASDPASQIKSDTCQK